MSERILKPKEVRQRLGLSGQEVAAMVGMDPTQLSRYERGDRRISIEHARALWHLYRPLITLGELHDPTFQAEPDVIADVVAERQRQIQKYGLEHDDEHTEGELPLAAAAYAYRGACTIPPQRLYPFEPSVDFSAVGARDACIRAIALLVAEVERRDRAEA